jgi:hypothetical protein
MAQLRPNEQSNGKIPARSRVNDRTDSPAPGQTRRDLVTQLGALSSLIEQQVQDLTQPMTVILGLNDLLLPQIEPGSRLALDLVAVTKQIRRMNQIVGEVNDLVEQRKKLLKVLGTLHLNSARQSEAGTATHSMREE